MPATVRERWNSTQSYQLSWTQSVSNHTITCFVFSQANCPSKTKYNLWDRILEKSRCGVSRCSNRINRWYPVWHLETVENVCKAVAGKLCSQSVSQVKPVEAAMSWSVHCVYRDQSYVACAVSWSLPYSDDGLCLCQNTYSYYVLSRLLSTMLVITMSDFVSFWSV